MSHTQNAKNHKKLTMLCNKVSARLIDDFHTLLTDMLVRENPHLGLTKDNIQNLKIPQSTMDTLEKRVTLSLHVLKLARIFDAFTTASAAIPTYSIKTPETANIVREAVTNQLKARGFIPPTQKP